MKTKEGASDKGQIKSEWIYEDIDFPNYHRKYLKDFSHERLFEVLLKNSTNDLKYTWQTSLNRQNIGLNHPISRDIRLQKV